MSWMNENLYGKTWWCFYSVLCLLSSGLSLLHHFTWLLHILVHFATGVLQLYGVKALILSLLISPLLLATFGLKNTFFEANTDKIIKVEIVQTLCFSLKFQFFNTCWWCQLDPGFCGWKNGHGGGLHKSVTEVNDNCDTHHQCTLQSLPVKKCH